MAQTIEGLDHEGVAQEVSSWVQASVTLKLTSDTIALQREDNNYSSNLPIQFFEGYRDAYVLAGWLFDGAILRVLGDGVVVESRRGRNEAQS